MKKDDSLSLELDGKVFIVEKTNGVITKTELDAELVLKCLSNLIEQAITMKLTDVNK